MQYSMYDRLCFDREIDGGHRAYKPEVVFNVFRAYKKKPSWKAIKHSNMSLFYGKLKTEQKNFIKNIASQTKKIEGSVNVSLFDRSEKLKSLGNELESKYCAFSYHPYKESFTTLLEDLVEYRDEIRKKTADKKMIEPANKKADIIILNIDDKDLQDLGDIEILKKLISLLHDSKWERIYIALVLSKASSLPKAIHKKLDWAAYLGNDNDMLCKEAHSELPDSDYSKQQIIIGSLYTNLPEPEIITIHPLKFSPSFAYEEREKRLDEDDKKYKEFLLTLNDGTYTNDN